MIWLYAILSVFLVSIISFIGVLTLVYRKNFENIVLYLVSFAAGALVGNALLHLLPEAIEHAGGFGITVSALVLAGIVISFLFENFVWNHYHTHARQHHHSRAKPVVYLNLLGDAIHNFIDGLIIGAAYLVSIPVGISTTIAVILHEIPQEIGDFGVLVHGGFSKIKALLFNFFSALTAVLGTVVALTLHATTDVVYFLIPFAAGNFLYIALTDLVPELHHVKKTKESYIHMFLFLVGVGVMVAILYLGHHGH